MDHQSIRLPLRQFVPTVNCCLPRHSLLGITFRRAFIPHRDLLARHEFNPSELFEEVLRQAHFLQVNEREASLFLKGSAHEHEPFTTEDVNALSDKLKHRGVHLQALIVTLGGKGAATVSFERLA